MLIRTEDGPTEFTDDKAYYCSGFVSLTEKREYACNLVKSNYQEYCSQGLLCTDNSVEYTIDNDDKTRDETAKKLFDLDKNIQTSFDWTMDNPKVKITFANEQATITFLKSVKCLIASNEVKLRDKKTEVGNFTLEQVDAFIDNPTYPTYERTV